MIKRLNSANAGVKRPLRIQDLQDIWDGLTVSLATGTDTTPRIISGFDLDSDTSRFSAGVIAFQNQLYYFPNDAATPLEIGDELYAHTADAEDTRVFLDGTTQLFSYNNVANTDYVDGVLIGEMTLENVDNWKRIAYSDLDSDLRSTITEDVCLRFYILSTTDVYCECPSNNAWFTPSNISAPVLSTDDTTNSVSWRWSIPATSVLWSRVLSSQGTGVTRGGTVAITRTIPMSSFEIILTIPSTAAAPQYFEAVNAVIKLRRE